MTNNLVPPAFSGTDPSTCVLLESMMNIVSDAIILLNIRQEILYFNQGAESIFGYSRSEITGKSLDLLVPDTAVEKHRHHFLTFASGEINARMMNERDEITVKRKNGEIFPAEATISKLEFNGEMFLAVIVRDTSKRKAMEEEIRQQNSDLSAFAHTVAHNLKNPMSVIIGYSALLSEEYERISQQELLKTLQELTRTSQRANAIIENLLLLAQVRKTSVTAVAVDMAAIVDQVQQRLQEMIVESKATVELPNHWHEAIGYPVWIEEVWMNYLSNGLKYGGDPPHLTVGSTQLSGGKIQFWVKDRGTGLTPKQQAVLFTEFTRLGQGKAAGHGLGLSIVKRIVTKLGGEVGIESTIGEGSVFYFTLPACNFPEESAHGEQ